MSYTDLTGNERHQIYSLKKAGLNQKEIAEHIVTSNYKDNINSNYLLVEI